MKSWATAIFLGVEFTTSVWAGQISVPLDLKTPDFTQTFDAKALSCTVACLAPVTKKVRYQCDLNQTLRIFDFHLSAEGLKFKLAVQGNFGQFSAEEIQLSDQTQPTSIFSFSFDEKWMDSWTPFMKGQTYSVDKSTDSQIAFSEIRAQAKTDLSQPSPTLSVQLDSTTVTEWGPLIRAAVIEKLDQAEGHVGHDLDYSPIWKALGGNGLESPFREEHASVLKTQVEENLDSVVRKALEQPMSLALAEGQRVEFTDWTPVLFKTEGSKTQLSWDF